MKPYQFLVFILAGWVNRRSTQPDGSKQIQTYTGGRLVSSVLQDSGGGQLGGTTYTYDAHGRVATTTDARNGTSTVTYYTTDEVASTTTPAPGGGGGAQTTTVSYDAAGRQDVVTLPDGGQVDYDYHPTGALEKVSGARTYSVRYGYDSQGRLITQTTNPGTAEAQVTNWAYEPLTGRLATKSLPGGSTVSYTYTTGGRTATRTNARNIVTTYTYNTAGDLAAISYSDATPGVTFAQGRNGQAASVAHNGSTYSYAYNDFGQVKSERVAGGLLGGVNLTHSYDALRRRTGLTAATGAAVVSQSFAYDPLVSRLKTVSQGDRSATYSYHANSALVSAIEHRTGGVVKMTDTRVFDNLNRLTSISAASVAGPAPAVALNLATAYIYNDANQRTLADRQDGSYWTYTYDGFGHVTSADQHLANGDLMAGRQFDYSFGALGNRSSASFGGDAAGGSMLTIGYTPGTGDRNQYAAIANPGVALTTGEANATASITVDTNAVTRQGDWFAYQAGVDNSAGAVYASLAIEATEGANTDNITRKQLVPAANVTPTYDADGNLTFDGYQDFTWDAENRLTSIEVRDALVPAGAPKYRIEFTYDYSGRRIATRVYGGGAGNWTLASETKYIYDGWNVVAEFSGTGLISKSYLWGLDLSGSMQGAGGVGGLLSTAQHLGDGTSRHFVAYDGNGNVIGLADADSGEMSALYEYDAFGQVLRMEGSYAVKNSYRFSTKPQEGLTGLILYELRVYNPKTGRWLSRDPVEESGGPNLYAFVWNDGVNGWDYLGLTDFRTPRGGAGHARLSTASGGNRVIIAGFAGAGTEVTDPEGVRQALDHFVSSGYDIHMFTARTPGISIVSQDIDKHDSRKQGCKITVIIVGHSAGGGQAIVLADEVNRYNFFVHDSGLNLSIHLLTMDPFEPNASKNNPAKRKNPIQFPVDDWKNFYQQSPVWQGMTATDPFNEKDEEVGFPHAEMDNMLVPRIIDWISQIVGAK